MSEVTKTKSKTISQIKADLAKTSVDDVLRRYYKGGQFNYTQFLNDYSWLLKRSDTEILEATIGKNVRNKDPIAALRALVLKKLVWIAKNSSVSKENNKRYNRMLHVARAFEWRIKDYSSRYKSNDITRTNFLGFMELNNYSVDWSKCKDPVIQWLGDETLFARVPLYQTVNELFRDRADLLKYVLGSYGVEFLTIMPATEDGLISMGGLQFTHHSIRKDGKGLGAANRGYQHLNKVGAASLKFEPGSVILLGGKNYFVMSSAQYVQALLELKRLMGDNNWTQLYKILTKGDDLSKDMLVSIGDYLLLYNYLPSVVKPLFIDWFKQTLKSPSFRKKYPHFNRFVQAVAGSSLKRRGITKHLSRYSKYISSMSDVFDRKYSHKFKKWDKYISLLGNYSYHLVKSMAPLVSMLETSSVIQYGSMSFGETGSDPSKLLNMLDKSFQDYFNDIRGFKNLAFSVPNTKSDSSKSVSSAVELSKTSTSREDLLALGYPESVIKYLTSESRTLRERRAKKKVLEFLVKYKEILASKGKAAAEKFKADWMKENLGLSGNAYVDESSKSRVALMQVFLNLQLLASNNEDVKLLTVDGVLGSKTKRAIRVVQKAVGVNVDGKFGSKTFSGILGVLGSSRKLPKVSVGPIRVVEVGLNKPKLAKSVPKVTKKKTKKSSEASKSTSSKKSKGQKPVKPSKPKTKKPKEENVEEEEHIDII